MLLFSVRQFISNSVYLPEVLGDPCNVRLSAKVLEGSGHGGR